MNRFKMRAKIWVYQGPGAWHFVTLPKSKVPLLKKYFRAHSRVWGSIPVKVQVGQSLWQTSFFPDQKSGSYLLPLKKVIRIQENLKAGDTVHFDLTILA